MIEARGLTKCYGPVAAVDALSFDVRPGVVTGFLGPNGSGKSTTMRLVLGLDRPTSGTARIKGRGYQELSWPLREVGALLEAKAFHPGRTLRSVRSNAGIAGTLVLTLGTVEKHVASIFAKLGLPASESDNRRVLAVLRYLGDG